LNLSKESFFFQEKEAQEEPTKKERRDIDELLTILIFTMITKQMEINFFCLFRVAYSRRFFIIEYSPSPAGISTVSPFETSSKEFLELIVISPSISMYIIKLSNCVLS
jgi:hypothetical protein